MLAAVGAAATDEGAAAGSAAAAGLIAARSISISGCFREKPVASQSSRRFSVFQRLFSDRASGVIHHPFQEQPFRGRRAPRVRSRARIHDEAQLTRTEALLFQQ